jgi:hypothetical protein
MGKIKGNGLKTRGEIIAERITAHLKRMEADPKINLPRTHESATGDSVTTVLFYHAGAGWNGNRVSISYVTYQGSRSLKLDEAELYLEALDAAKEKGIKKTLYHWQVIEAAQKAGILK